MEYAVVSTNNTETTVPESPRLIIPFTPIGICAHPTSPIDNKFQIVPEELSSRGLTQQQWSEQMEKLHTICSPRTPCFWAFCPFLYFSYLFPFFLPCYCSQNRRKVLEWNQRLIQWETQFNQEFLKRKGILLKIQSSAVALGKGRKISRFLTFSFTPSDQALLQNEPRLQGNIFNASCCMGIDENQDDLICHPNDHI